MRRSIPLLVLLASLSACRTTATTEPTPTPTPGTETNAASSTDRLSPILEARLQLQPLLGVELGLHDYDGKLPDVSADGLARALSSLRGHISELEAMEQPTDASARVEHAALTTALRGDLFELEARRAPQRNPMFYLGPLDLTPYISRDYAPLPDRVRAIIAVANATPAHLENAKANLEVALPRTFLQTALLQTRGTSTFVRVDVAKATSAIEDPELRKELHAALGTMAKALDEYAAFLDSALTKANDEFALGPDAFARMLSQTQGINVDLAELEEVLAMDLTRNSAAMAAAAKALDPKRSVAEVVADVTKRKPATDKVLATASAQAVDMRKFLLDHDIVTIPSEDVAEVVETPPFMRWNAAFLSGAGVFEEKALPSFYYISPPDPSWPVAKQREYIPGETDLLFITIHEVWPGHFLHSLHLKVNPSKILKSTWNYTTGEGWAHYTEEMMWDEKISEDPAVHIGQLQNALLRNVRAISAIGLHTKGMTVAESKQMFVEVAFQDEANAEQQAVRGTFDPMYLAYTTGKLAILKLRADLRAKLGDAFSQKAFHDELLSYGGAPLSAIRAAMLGDDPGSIL